MFLVNGSGFKTAEVQDALDALVAEGRAARGEEGTIRGRRQAVGVWRAVEEKG